MKTKFYFGLLAAAALSMTACSNENEPNNSPAEEGTHYMSVKIRTAGLGGTRAPEAGNPEFETGVGTESTVTAPNIRFLFFDGSGNAFTMVQNGVNGTVRTNMVTPTEITTTNGQGNNEAEITGTLVLGTGDGGYKGMTPTQVLVVANGDENRLKTIENQNLETVLTRTATTPTVWPPIPGFLMTSSVYYAGGNRVAAVNIANNIKTEKQDAEKAPAVLYIERAAAKVRATYNSSFDVQSKAADGTVSNPGSFTFFDVENDEIVEKTTQFTAEINGWQLLNKAGQTAAFKQLPATLADATTLLGKNDANDNWVWNDEPRHRSYWSNSNAGTNWIAPYTNASGTSPLLERDGAYANQSFDSNNATANVEYCYENTGYTNVTEFARGNFATAITIKATIKKDGKAIDMYRIAGEYYSKAAMEKLVKTSYIASHGDLTEDRLTVQLSDNTPLDNTYTPVVYADGATTGTSMTQFSTMLWWKNGVTSYHLNIMHLNGKPGVVRNHIYDYKINGIIGLGVPGNEPYTPELSETYLEARLYILDWHVVSNNIVIQ